VAVGAGLLGEELGLGVAVRGMIVNAALLALLRCVARAVVRAARRAGRFQQRVLLVGESSVTAHLAEELVRRPSEGYLVVGAVGEAAKQFRRVNGFLHLPALRAALEAHANAAVTPQCDDDEVAA